MDQLEDRGCLVEAAKAIVQSWMRMNALRNGVAVQEQDNVTVGSSIVRLRQNF